MPFRYKKIKIFTPDPYKKDIMNSDPIEIPTQVAIIAAKVAEFLEFLPENQGDAYVTTVHFGFHGEPHEGLYVGPNDFDGYALFAKESTT